MARASKVVISDALIIKACNTPGGSGGVAREMNDWVKRCKLRAINTAPVNDPANATHRGGAVGTYKASFRSKRSGNQHVLSRAVFNIAPHAPYVEYGRRSTRFGDKFYSKHWPGWPVIPGNNHIVFTPLKVMAQFGNWEQFGWTKHSGIVRWYAGTSAREGKYVLLNSWKWTTEKYQVDFLIADDRFSGMRYT
jgi:hypothetical protein